MKILISLTPVLLFLGALLWFDSFRLIHRWVLVLCLLWGGVSASLSLVANTLASDLAAIPFEILSRYVAPFTEEVLKLLVLLLLIARHRIGFSIDAAIYGFAAGTGFAFTENLVYLLQVGPEEAGLWTWISRGTGSALMHGGATAVAGVLLVNRLTDSRHLFQPAVLAVVTSYLIHACYNMFLLSPWLSALVSLILVPSFMIFVFHRGERYLRSWLDVGMDEEAGLLRMIRHGRFPGTRAGRYLFSLTDHFPPQTAADMYRYVALYLELSIRAKGRLLLNESGFPSPVDPGSGEKADELEQLGRRIGKSGLLALRPLLRMNRSDLWALSGYTP